MKYWLVTYAYGSDHRTTWFEGDVVEWFASRLKSEGSGPGCPPQKIALVFTMEISEEQYRFLTRGYY